MVEKNDKLKVGYLGPEGTYSHEVVIRRFGSDVELVSAPHIAGVFDLLHNKQVQHGVVPIENSTEGAVRATLDSFLGSFVSYVPIIQGPGSGIKITEELLMDINLNLLGVTKSPDTIKTIYAHEQAIAQSRNWLNKNFPNAVTVAVDSSTLAVLKAKATKDRSAAAIASDYAASIYGLEAIAHNIQDSGGNTTRFVVLGGDPPPPSGNDKTSLLVSAPHEPGALLSILKPLARKGVNLTHLESRPWGEQNWEYAFFIEIKGHQKDKSLQGALEELKEIIKNRGLFLILGSYPVASTQAVQK